MKKLLVATVATLAMGAVVMPAVAQATPDLKDNGVPIGGTTLAYSYTTSASGTPRILLTASNGATVACTLTVSSGSTSSWVGMTDRAFVAAGDLAFNNCVSNTGCPVTATNNNDIDVVFTEAGGTYTATLSNISFTDFLLPSPPCPGGLTFTGTLATDVQHDAAACGGNGGLVLEFTAGGGTLAGPGGLTAIAAGFQVICLQSGGDLTIV